MRALVTGATGLIGRRLVRKLQRPLVLSRDPVRAACLVPEAEIHRWSPESSEPSLEALGRVDVVFHLAGEPVAEGRWSTPKKARIIDSRVVGTRRLVAGLARLEQRPGVLVAASAVGYYGNQADRVLDEDSPPGDGFLADVCVAWEREAMKARDLGVRVVCARMGIVLARGGGALGRMLVPFRLGLGGRLGCGRQWMSWIHLDDVVGLLIHAGVASDIQGPINVVGPSPVTNGEFTHALAAAVGRPALLPLPEPILRLLFGEKSEMLLDSQRVNPAVAERSGYRFRHSEISGALRELVGGVCGRDRFGRAGV
ncbi:MAG: TIGR01777 family oxidoreductase [Candidatus Binatia bacterium]